MELLAKKGTEADQAHVGEPPPTDVRANEKSCARCDFRG